MKIGKHRKPLDEAEMIEQADLTEHCPKMLPPYEAHGAHEGCAGLAAHPLTQIGRRS